MATAAERSLNFTKHNGETKWYNFDKYIKVHINRHQILTNIKEYGYKGINEVMSILGLIQTPPTPRTEMSTYIWTIYAGWFG